ncbi:prolyl-tRNA synthetase associated domain-containing protein [Rhodospirillaceae bacterium KN72]|uniref:Prolyl-tRNA synthetase associated domain-containing protein n=1 Tax=Pacificispira spongiicola TaxID=2729598 RepID=A0A7Y0E216_9PROT|nr:YbaK/EbsC family protein [Pacificispira spongiicola]NMM45793.1 prolyl-tRNA synthetase associated domain-containing protein [Pacificispira spongiicola]
MPKTEADLFATLDALGIDHRTVDHAPLYTVEDSQRLRGELDGLHIKNLFLRDKKKRLWLCTVEEDRIVDLKALKQRLGAQGNLSFGNPELLMEVLGVIPGAVTPFGVINDTDRQVTMVLDADIPTAETVNCHPLRNDRTTAVSGAGLMAFLKDQGYDPLLIDFTEPLTDA